MEKLFLIGVAFLSIGIFSVDAAQAANFNHKLSDVLDCTGHYVQDSNEGIDIDLRMTVEQSFFGSPNDLEANVGLCLTNKGYKYSPQYPAWPSAGTVAGEQLVYFVNQMVSHIR